LSLSLSTGACEILAQLGLPLGFTERLLVALNHETPCGILDLVRLTGATACELARLVLNQNLSARASEAGIALLVVESPRQLGLLSFQLLDLGQITLLLSLGDFAGNLEEYPLLDGIHDLGGRLEGVVSEYVDGNLSEHICDDGLQTVHLARIPGRIICCRALHPRSETGGLVQIGARAVVPLSKDVRTGGEDEDAGVGSKPLAAGRELAADGAEQLLQSRLGVAGDLGCPFRIVWIQFENVLPIVRTPSSVLGHDEDACAAMEARDGQAGDFVLPEHMVAGRLFTFVVGREMDSLYIVLLDLAGHEC